MSRSRIKKIKSTTSQPEPEAADIFFMDLQEVREALSSKYEFLADRYEQKNFPKHKGIS